jgi:anti-sigma regulatory factor (Ser/Thr protein kinase)
VEVMDPVQVCIPVSDASQVGEVRRTVARMAQTLALSESRRGDASIAATELATNLVRHARHGRVLLQVIAQGASGWLELLSVDDGPGMTDVQRCLQDGYSTVGTPGCRTNSTSTRRPARAR